MNFDILKRTVFLTLHGSHAYGTSRPSSDIDVKGIAIPTKEYFLGFGNKFEQYEGQYPLSEEQLNSISGMINRQVMKDEQLDSVIYDIRKFFHLASQCNPNIIEILFTDESYHILSHPILNILFENRDVFLSTKANFRFRGYAFSQLKRIKRHRKWLLDPPTKKPEREDFDLPPRTVIPADQLQAAESLIKKKVEEWIFEQDEMTPELLSSVRNKTIESFKEIFSGLKLSEKIVDDDNELDANELSNSAGHLLGYSDNFLEILDRERRYKSSITQYKQYKKWEKERNPARAELESKYGYDCKHASHLVRLMRMSKEILSEGKVIVCRPDAADLLEIRNGSWSYDELIDWATKQDEEIQELYDSGKSPLPKTPNIKRLDEICIMLVERSMAL
jgi:predicted nucleotidyltransferase